MLKRVIVQNVAPDGDAVLNADDPIVASMAAFSSGGVILFARSRDNPTVATHLLRGGRAVFVEDASIVASGGGQG